MSKPVILAIDIGSSSVRAAFYDHDAQPVKRLTARRGWSFRSTTNGGSEMDPEAAFAVVCSAIDDLLSKPAARKVEVTHIALCSFWHSLMGIDSRGKPTTPVLGWADTRSGAFSAQLKKRFDEHDVHNRTGAHFHSSFWPAKLLWLRKEWPDTFAKTVKWLGFGDYAALRLTGRCITSVSMASATGIFDQERLDWDPKLLRYLRVRRPLLPEISRSGVSFELGRTTLKRWPQLEGAKLLPSIGDGAADHMGSCGIGKGKASLMIGTSAAMRIAYKGGPPDQIPNGLWCYRIDDKRVIAGGALSDGGNLYEWCQRTFRLGKDVEAHIRRRDRGRRLPTVMPFFHGERSTGYREDARGAICDLAPSHDGVDILEAAVIAVAERLSKIYQLLGDVAPINKVFASGGALRRSPLWREMIARALDADLEVTPTDESALRGVALYAIDQVGDR